MFSGPDTTQETLKKPKYRQGCTQKAPKAQKKTTKKKQDKCTLGKKCLKPAISFLTNSETIFNHTFCLFLKLIFCFMFFAT